MSCGLEGNMDNANKVTRPEDSDNIFLKNAIIESGGAPEIYSLEREFSRTKREKKVTAYILLMIFMLFILGASFFFSIMIQNRFQKTEINISDFEDLNLEELLGSAKKVEYKLNQARADLNDLDKERQEKMYQVKEGINQEKQLVLNNGDLSSQEKNEKLAVLDKLQKQRMESVNVQYERKIADKKIEVAELETEYNQMDSEVMKSAQKTETVMNSYQKLYELQMQKMRKDFEAEKKQMNNEHEAEIKRIEKYNKQLQDILILKYNPRFSIKQVLKEAGVVDAVSQATPRYNGDSKTYNKIWDYQLVLEKEKIFSLAEFDNLRKQQVFMDAILGRLDAIPYTNSVAPALDELLFLHYLSLHEYEYLWYSLANRLSEKIQLLDYYRWALQSYATDNRESGYILDARNPQKIVAFIDDIYQVQKGDQAIVFRGDQQFIAKVSLTPLKDSYQVTVLEQSPTNRIKSLDKILLLKQEENK